MAIPTHENKYVKNCLNCNKEITDLKEEHLYCTQCGFPVRNECTGTSNFNNGYGNNEVQHDIDDDFYVLNPEDAFCPKCSAASLFNIRGLIDVKYPKVEILHPQPDNDDIPF